MLELSQPSEVFSQQTYIVYIHPDKHTAIHTYIQTSIHIYVVVVVDIGRYGR